MQEPTTLAVGNFDHAEFRDVADWLSTCAARRFASCQEALDALDRGAAPSWIFLLAGHRGTFEPASVEALHQAAPLARVVMICGSWCEGESRSGRMLSGVPRVYWHQFSSRLAGVDNPAADHAGWTLPRTATAIDVALAAARRPSRQLFPSSGPTVGIATARREDFAALSDSVLACGLVPIWLPASNVPPHAHSVLWNGGSLRRANGLRGVVEQAGSRPVIALLDFPRRDELAEARHLGVAAVVSKPFLLGDLRAVLERAGCFRPAEIVREAG